MFSQMFPHVSAGEDGSAARDTDSAGFLMAVPDAAAAEAASFAMAADSRSCDDGAVSCSAPSCGGVETSRAAGAGPAADCAGSLPQPFMQNSPGFPARPHLGHFTLAFSWDMG